ncbi:MAG TPA: S8/S53 family peptidase [Cyclobacteriaceae bacterium]
MALTSRWLFLIIYFLAFAAHAQDNRYLIFFKDKEGTTFSTSDPTAFLSERAVERRTRQRLVVIAQDLPVNPNYVQGVSSTGANVLHPTRWMNGVLVECDETMLAGIQALPYVDRVELVAQGSKPENSGRRRSTARSTDAGESLVTANQLSMLGIDEMHASGYHGEGVNIAILDAGFPGVNTAGAFSHIVDEDRLITTYDFVHDDGDVFVQSNHGTSVFSVIGAYIPDAFTGGAYGASFQLYITEDVASEYRIEEYNWLFAAERADSAGADIISTSLGYNTFDDPTMDYSKADLDGITSVIARAAQWASDRGIAVVSSAGNEGSNSWETITTPADNEYVLAVAAVTPGGVRSPISSIGPSADGRIKPDVAAMGIGVSVVNAAGNLSTSSGTSLSAPLITSLLAGVWQRYPGLTSGELMEAVRSSASQAENPDFLLGYGIPNFEAIVNKLDWEPQDRQLSISPNPVTDTLTIRPDDPSETSTCFVEILSLQGQVLSSQEVEFDWIKKGFQADCSKLAAGMYFLRIRTGEEIFSFKVVKL